MIAPRSTVARHLLGVLLLFAVTVASVPCFAMPLAAAAGPCGMHVAMQRGMHDPSHDAGHETLPKPMHGDGPPACCQSAGDTVAAPAAAVQLPDPVWLPEPLRTEAAPQPTWFEAGQGAALHADTASPPAALPLRI